MRGAFLGTFLRTFVVVVTILRLSAATFAADPSTQPIDLTAASAQMASAGGRFFAALTPEQQARAMYDFAHDERLNWAFVPKSRNGLPFRDMTAPQREAAMALLKSGMSERGYEKADAIMNQIELILKDLENGAARRDPGLYYVTLFGKPDAEGTWAWRVEGHHVAINFTIVDGKAITGAPMFLGSNPATVKSGPKAGTRILGAEEDVARSLVKSLSDDQRKLAIISQTPPRDITTGNARKITPGAPAGTPASKLTDGQKQTLHKLIDEYATRLRDELAAQDLKKIETAGFDNVHFAWAGGLESGQGHYYRIQGPTFMIEYDNTQNNANHVHTVWRDPTNDFGADMLKQHYKRGHAHDHK